MTIEQRTERTFAELVDWMSSGHGLMDDAEVMEAVKGLIDRLNAQEKEFLAAEVEKHVNGGAEGWTVDELRWLAGRLGRTIRIELE